MNITQRLQELDPTLVRHIEGAWDKPFDPASPSYSSFNDAGIEIETGEFFYSLTRLLKPDHVLETGTHIGIGMAYMGMALKDNNKGQMDTIEFIPEIYHRAIKRREDLGLEDVVDMHQMDVAHFQPKCAYKLILLDTEPQTRFAEFEKFWPFLEEGGFIFIHDLHRHMGQHPNEEHGFGWPYGPLPYFMKEKVRNEEARPVHFDTPRGLTGFYKVHPGDYLWKK